MDSRAGKCDMIVHKYAVVADGKVSGAEQFAFFVKQGAGEDYVVSLPLAGRAAGVDEGRILSVDGGGLAIGVGLVVIGVEDLHLIFAH